MKQHLYLMSWILLIKGIQANHLRIHGFLKKPSDSICFDCTGWLRSLIADYGVPLMVLVWTGVSYIPAGDVPKGIPRRLFSPNPWSPGAYGNWTVVKVCLFL